MAKKAHSAVVIFHSSVVIFERVQLWFFTVQLWFLKQFSCDFSAGRKRLEHNIRELRQTSVFLPPFWKAVNLSSSLCLKVLGVLNDGCYNKATCPRGNKTSEWTCLYEFWSSASWTKAMNGKLTVRNSWPHQRSVKREEKKDWQRTSNPSCLDSLRQEVRGFCSSSSEERWRKLVRCLYCVGTSQVEELKQKATALFFPDGKSAFAGSVDDMLLDICDTTQTAIIRFPGEGTIESYLKENGL